MYDSSTPAPHDPCANVVGMVGLVGLFRLILYSVRFWQWRCDSYRNGPDKTHQTHQTHPSEEYGATELRCRQEPCQQWLANLGKFEKQAVPLGEIRMRRAPAHKPSSVRAAYA